MQVPPFWQGLDRQSSMSISQFSPVKPWAQLQLQTEPLAWQVPPCRHGLFWHGSAGACRLVLPVPV